MKNPKTTGLGGQRSRVTLLLGPAMEEEDDDEELGHVEDKLRAFSGRDQYSSIALLREPTGEECGQTRRRGMSIGMWEEALG
jgi:hypothetical protein